MDSEHMAKMQQMKSMMQEMMGMMDEMMGGEESTEGPQQNGMLGDRLAKMKSRNDMKGGM